MTPATATDMEILPIVTARGDAAALGHAQGEAFRATIQRFVPMRWAAAEAYFGEHGLGTVDALKAAGARCFEVFERWDPVAYLEHVAIAEAARVSPVALFTAGNYTDIRDVVMLAAPPAAGTQQSPDPEGCSVLLLPGTHTQPRAVLWGQTWDLNPEDLGYVVAVHRLPTHGPETWSVTVAGCPSLVGMNQYGVSVGTTNIKCWGARIGVGYMNLLHRMLAQPTRAAAQRVLLEAPRAGAHTFYVTDGGGGGLFETAPDVAVYRDLADGPVFQTNHCQDRALRALEWQPKSASSRLRAQRLARVSERQDHTLASLRGLFASREDGAESINRYPEDGLDTATNAVIAGAPAQRELWACRGPADRGRWRHLCFERGRQTPGPAETAPLRNSGSQELE